MLDPTSLRGFGTQMFLTHLEIENFRALKRVKVDLHSRANVFAGVNGAGKSTLLVAVHLHFSRYVSAMRTGRPSGRGPALKELRAGAETVCLGAVAEHRGQAFRWRVERTFKGLHSRTTTEDLEGFRNFIKDQQRVMDDPEHGNVPLFTTYPVSRAILDVPLRVRTRDQTRQSAAFQSTSLSTARHFRSFFAWFRDREDYENERRLDVRDYRDPQISAVRRAVACLLPGYGNLRVKRRPLRLVVTKGETEFDIENLSDGEKGLIALAGDLARRMSLANPGLREPLTGSGIVMIDELELHLHPAWQRNALRGLLEAFPNIQFIFTTHSPQIISELQPDQIFLLKDGEAISVARSYGMESTQVLRQLMGDPGRPLQVEEQLRALNALIDDGRFREGEEKLEELSRQMGDADPVLSIARTRIRRGKALRDFEAHR